ncbi:MAG TPA: hypothetical protein VL332_02465 [Candidatus Saccharimonadaceae bacterium]|jgi:hypothetical protein|nr:hypothetical protein [Candidatus Saccharimonadaceae bacterium]
MSVVPLGTDAFPGTDDAFVQALAQRLVGEPATTREIERWRDALACHGAALVARRDRRLWALMRRAPFLIGAVDAGLAWRDPHGVIRQRLCLLLAVLEASPAHVARFVDQPYPLVALAGLAPRMAFAALRVALGLVVVLVAEAPWP